MLIISYVFAYYSPIKDMLPYVKTKEKKQLKIIILYNVV